MTTIEKNKIFSDEGVQWILTLHDNLRSIFHVRMMYPNAFEQDRQVKLTNYQEEFLAGVANVSDNNLSLLIRSLKSNHPFSKFKKKLEDEKNLRRLRESAERRAQDIARREEHLLIRDPPKPTLKKQVEDFLSLKMTLEDPDLLVLLYDIVYSLARLGVEIAIFDAMNLVSFVIQKIKRGNEMHNIPTVRIVCSKELHDQYPQWQQIADEILSNKDLLLNVGGGLSNILSVPMNVVRGDSFDFLMRRSSKFSDFVLTIIETEVDVMLILHLNGLLHYSSRVQDRSCIVEELQSWNIYIPFCQVSVITPQKVDPIVRMVNKVWESSQYLPVETEFEIVQQSNHPYNYDPPDLMEIEDQAHVFVRKKNNNRKTKTRKRKRCFGTPIRYESEEQSFKLEAKNLFSSFDPVTALKSLERQYDSVQVRSEREGTDHNPIWVCYVDLPFNPVGTFSSRAKKKKTARFQLAELISNYIKKGFIEPDIGSYLEENPITGLSYQDLYMGPRNQEYQLRVPMRDMKIWDYSPNENSEDYSSDGFGWPPNLGKKTI